jgi:acetyl esterase/lipase
MKNISIILVCLLIFNQCKKKPADTPPTTLPVIPERTTKFDIAYGNLHSSQKSDIYTPAVVGPFPVVVLIHGGGWVQGDKQGYRNGAVLEALLSRGYAVVAINYRLSFTAKYPAQIQDVKAAIRWIKANAAAYNFNPAKIGAWGSSAGGHLTALLATSSGINALEDFTIGDASKTSKIQAAVDWFGPTDFLQMDAQTIAQGCGANAATHNNANSPESALMGFPIQTQPALVQLANPVYYVTADDTPIYIQHGQGDCTVPYNQSKILYDALISVKGTADVKYQLLNNSGHGTGQFENTATITSMVDFLDQYLK